jgi:hypothetical protein
VRNDHLIEVMYGLQHWCDQFNGGTTPSAIAMIGATASNLAISEVILWDSENGFTDEADDTDDVTVERCIRCYKRLIGDMSKWPVEETS